MSIPVRMPLDYSMIALVAVGPHPEIVADAFPWGVFSKLGARYEEERRRYNRRQTEKRKRELKRKRGRSPSATSMDYTRMPELFCGFSRTRPDYPVIYPVACSHRA